MAYNNCMHLQTNHVHCLVILMNKHSEFMRICCAEFQLSGVSISYFVFFLKNTSDSKRFVFTGIISFYRLFSVNLHSLRAYACQSIFNRISFFFSSSLLFLFQFITKKKKYYFSVESWFFSCHKFSISKPC